MGNTDIPSKRNKIVFDKLSRENYFEKLNQALANLSIIDGHREKRIRIVKNKVNLLEETST